MFEEKKQRVTRKFIDSLGIILVTVISFVYLFKGFFEPSWSNVPIWIRVLDAVVSIIVAVGIQSSLGLQALIKGMQSDENLALKEEHINVVKEANEYADYADDWAHELNQETVKNLRFQELSKGGLKYVNFFDEDGVYNGNLIPKPKGRYMSPQKKQYRHRIKALKRAINVKVYYVTFAAVSASDSNNNSGSNTHNLGRTPMEFHNVRTTKKLMGKIVYVAILSQLTWALILGRNAMEQLFNGAIQIALYLMLGGIDYFINWLYMAETHPNNVRRKINYAKNLIDFGKKKRGEETWQEKMKNEETQRVL